VKEYLGLVRDGLLILVLVGLVVVLVDTDHVSPTTDESVKFVISLAKEAYGRLAADAGARPSEYELSQIEALPPEIDPDEIIFETIRARRIRTVSSPKKAPNKSPEQLYREFLSRGRFCRVQSIGLSR
jgi:hypothetical protein